MSDDRRDPFRFLVACAVGLGFALVPVVTATLVTADSAHAESVGIFAGTGSPNPGGKPLASPHGLAIGPDGTVWIADKGNDRVVGIKDRTVTIIGGDPACPEWEDQPPTQGEAIQPCLKGPQGVAVGKDGTVFIADTLHSRVVSVRGNSVKLISGTGAFGSRIDENDATKTELKVPEGVAVANDGTVVIADTHNNRVLTVKDNRVTLIAGDRDGEQTDMFDRGDATNTGLRYPSDVAIAPNGTILILEYWGNRVLAVKYGRPRVVVGKLRWRGEPSNTPDGLYYPRGFGLAPDGTIVIADTYNHRVIGVKGGWVTSLVVDGRTASGQVLDPNSSGGHHFPHGLAVAPDGTIVFSAVDPKQVFALSRESRHQFENLVERGMQAGRERDCDWLRRVFFDLTYHAALHTPQGRGAFNAVVKSQRLDPDIRGGVTVSGSELPTELVYRIGSESDDYSVFDRFFAGAALAKLKRMLKEDGINYQAILNGEAAPVATVEVGADPPPQSQDPYAWLDFDPMDLDEDGEDAREPATKRRRLDDQW